MDGAEAQDRGAVRCVAPGMIKSELAGDAVMRSHADHHSCNSSTPMEPGDRTNEDPQNSGLDSKTINIKQIVEDAISHDSKQTVMRILDQVNELSTAEKLLLYLKLPTGKSGNVDPLRQPLNPLGSRFEIHQTITWIRTHLEEDPDVSLPKQDVYDEYIAYCNSNAMKPLSTADFGKVMKQVFPRVRPRRLGTRGNSRYCYAGMRKRMKLEAPLLPDLGEEAKSSGGSCSEDELVSAASCLVCEWAQKLLGVTFKNLRDLACHLVENLCVDSRSVAAFTILSAASSGGKGVPSLAPCVGKATSSLGLQVVPPGGAASKHRETQLQLQRKLQEREVIREQKRKLQEQTAALGKKSQVLCSLDKGKGKRLKLSTTKETSTNNTTQGDDATAPQAICDKGRGRGRRTCQPVEENGTSESKPIAGLKRSHSASEACKPTTTFSPVQELKAPENKLPIPRLSKAPSKQLANVIIIPPILQQKKKYKPIQPKPEDLGEKKKEAVSIGCLEKDALDDYLHGDNNSQEQEEELMRYFQHQEPDGSKSDKLSQLRLLLERNLSSQVPLKRASVEDSAPSNGDVFLPNSAAASLSLLSQRSQTRGAGKPTLLLPNGGAHTSLGSRRRVSFETSVMEHHQDGMHHATSSVPPSPNTRRRIFSFTPISPGPHSPLGPQRASSSANASPFVSPRNTPVPRSRHNSGQNQPSSSYLAQNGARHSNKVPRISRLPVQTTGDMFAVPGELHLPGARQPAPPVSTSAPQSPMIPFQLTEADLQEVLQTAKTFVTPDPLAQEVSQFFPDDQNLTSVQQYRSQSVPLHYQGIVAPTPVPSEFTDFVAAAPTDLLMANGDTELNSENLNRIFNLLDEEQQKGGLTLNVDAAQQHNQKFLFQPSRSYPNTPLPYQSTRDPVVASFAASLPSDSGANLTSRSYPSTPLMGLPMFVGSEEDGPFQQGLGTVAADGTSVSQLTLNALNIRTAARRNINTLLEQSPFCVDDELALDTLDALQECDTLSQFVQEVNHPAPDAGT